MALEVIISKTINVPCVGFGTYKLTGETCIKVVEEALQFGYRHIDTAQYYNNEEAIGTAVKNSSLDRDKVFITTKIFPTDFSRMIPAVEDSLRRLQMDRVDLLLLHWPSDDKTNSIAIEGLNQALNTFEATEEHVDPQRLQAWAAQFEPLNGSSVGPKFKPAAQLSWGRMIFQWHTVPTPPASAPAASL